MRACRCLGGAVSLLVVNLTAHCASRQFSHSPSKPPNQASVNSSTFHKPTATTGVISFSNVGRLKSSRALRLNSASNGYSNSEIEMLKTKTSGNLSTSGRLGFDDGSGAFVMGTVSINAVTGLLPTSRRSLKSPLDDMMFLRSV